MDVFKIQETLVNDYKSYVESFVSIRDPFIRQFVKNEYDKGRYWPEALVQLNPAFSPGPTVPELVANGMLHDRCDDIFRADLDGIYAHLYGISRDDFAYILDTFPIVARKDIAEFGEYRTKRLCLEAYDHFSPESLRTLELQVREIELALRRTIVRALDGDVDALPSHIKAKLFDEYAKHSPNGDGAPSLRTLLDSSYLTDLEKIIRSDGVWSTVGDQFGSKSRFRGYVSDLNDFRNPMAHNRGVSEDVREKGETAVAWFTEALQGQMLRA